MPTCLFVNPSINRKSLKLLLILLFSPLFFYGQSLTGLWIGTTSNDSTTVRKEQSFEIALTEYRGKVYGYSRSEFIVDEVLYYVVKRVKGIIEGDVCEVIDDEIIAFNFPTKLDKGVKVTSTFRRNRNDSTWQLEGTWKTNATKKFYAVAGKVELEEEKDLTASKIFPHLEELKIANEIAFYKERVEGVPIVKIARPEKIKSGITRTDKDINEHTETLSVVAIPNIPVTEKSPTNSSSDTEKKRLVEDDVAIVNENFPAIKKTSDDLPTSETKRIVSDVAEKKIAGPAVADKATALNKPVIIEGKMTPVQAVDKAEDPKTGIVKKESIATAQNENNKPEKTNTSVNKKPVTPIEKKELVKQEKPVQTNSLPKSPVPQNTAIEEKQTIKTVSVAPVEKRIPKPEVELVANAAVIAGRKSEFTQAVNFKSDSLVLSLYDNGEIDGDTVSVYLNGEVIMARQGLKASAIKKTIYVTKGNEDFTLVLFADNLGKYPPNTGLLVVHDGDEVYNLRFSSDFQKNAGIVFRRKIE